MITLSQAMGSPLSLQEIPKRIVSLVPSITETLFEFETPPVGRTSFCIEPRDRVREIPVVGGTKTPKIKKVVELDPDLVIANQEENRKEDVEAMISKGLNVWVTYPVKVSDVVDLLLQMSQFISNQKKANDLASNLRKTTSVPPVPKNTTFLALIWKDPWMVVGDSTYAGNLVETAGGRNLAKDREGRYPTLEKEEILALKPDLLLLPSEPFAFDESHKEFWKNEFAEKELKTRVELCSGEDLSWFGSRTAKALETLTSLLYSVSQSFVGL